MAIILREIDNDSVEKLSLRYLPLEPIEIKGSLEGIIGMNEFVYNNGYVFLFSHICFC